MIRRTQDGELLWQRDAEEAPAEERVVEIEGFTRPTSWDPEKRTLDFVLSDERTNTVARFDWFSGERIDEQLSLDPSHVRLERMNNGAPFLRVHRGSNDLMQIGKWVEGSVRVEGKVGERTLVGTVAFSPNVDEESERIVQDYAQGYRRNASVGWREHETIVTKRDDGPNHHFVVDWEPMEGSGVPMGADDGAVTRAASAAPVLPKRTERIETMTQRSAPQTETPGAQPATPDPAEVERLAHERADAILVERAARKTEIERIGSLLKLDGETVEGHVEQRDAQGALVSIDAVREAMFAAAEARERQPANHVAAGQSLRVTPGGHDENDVLALSVVGHLLCGRGKMSPQKVREAMIARGGDDGGGRFVAQGVDIREFDFGREGHRFSGSHRGSLIALAETCLRADGVVTERMGVNEIVSRVLGGDVRQRGANTTTTFPLALAEAFNVSLSLGWDERPLYIPWAKKTTADDFRDQHEVTMGEAEDLIELGEHGEFQRSTMGESDETYRIETFGREFELTRRLMINDKIGAVTGIPLKFGRAGKRRVRALVLGLLITPPNMSDGQPLISGIAGNRTFTNIAAAAAVPSIAAIDAARVAMNSRPPLNAGLDPETQTFTEWPIEWFVCSDLWSTRFEQVLGITRTANRADGAGIAEQVPRSFGGYDVAPDPLLNAFNPGGGAGNAWFAVADGAVTYAYLTGSEGVQAQVYTPEKSLGLVFRAFMDVGAGALQARAIQRNNGAAS